MEGAEYDTLRALEDHFWWYRALHALIAREVSAIRRTRAGSLSLLDAGCGTGGMLSRIASLEADGDRARRIERTGLDWSPRALRHARARGHARLARGSVETLPFRDRSFDLIVSLDVLYHREVRSDLAALREFARCLKPGGRAILHLPAFESLRSSHDVAIHTARRYRREPLARLLREAGLDPVRVTYRNAFLFPALAAVRWLRRKDARFEEGAQAPPQSDVRPLPIWLDRSLYAVLAAESAWLRVAGLPFGLSLLAIAEKRA